MTYVVIGIVLTLFLEMQWSGLMQDLCEQGPKGS